MKRGSRARRLTVIVEDTPSFAEMVRSYLDSMGRHLVITCATAAEARRVLARHRPSLMFVDVGLTDGSGVDICRAARARNPHMAIVVITANSITSTFRNCIDAGADDFIEKSADIGRVFERVRYWSSQQRARIGTSQRQSIVASIDAFSRQLPESANDLVGSQEPLGTVGTFLSLAPQSLGLDLVASLRNRIFFFGYSAGAALAFEGADDYLDIGFRTRLQNMVIQSGLLSDADVADLIDLLPELSGSEEFQRGRKLGRAEFLVHLYGIASGSRGAAYPAIAVRALRPN